MKKLFSISVTCLFISLLAFFGHSFSDDPADFNSLEKNPPIPQNYDFNSGTSATWTTLTASPHAQSRTFCAMVTIGGVDYIYQFGGGSGALLTNVARYNINTMTWTNNYSTMPQGISSGTAVVMDDSLLFVFGGNNPSLGFTLKYNYITNVWSTMANMPTPVTDAGCVKHGNLVYVVGGGTGLFGTGYFNTVQVYNTQTNTYSSATNYPLAVGMMGIGIQGDTIIAAGGWDGAGAVANAYKGIINSGNPNLITWTPIANYPGGAVTRMGSAPVRLGTGGGIMFAGGAIGGATLTATSYLYNMCSNTWENLPNISQARSNFKGASQNGDVAYIVGGFTTVGVGTFERVTFTDITGSCFTGGGGNETLVLLHDSTVNAGGSQGERKADRDTLLNALSMLISEYDVMTFDTTTSLPDLSNYKTIILQETSFDDPLVRYLGQTARGQLVAWINSGTSGNKKALLSINADNGYNYSRSGSPARDLVLSQNLMKFVYQADNSGSIAPPTITGLDIDNGNTHGYSTATSGFWPDGVSVETGGDELYHYTGRGTDDSLCGVGYNGTGYVSAALNMDPRYFTGTFKVVLEKYIEYLVVNGGTITGVHNVTSNVPEGYNLSQNYPNPFNPTTKISFSIPKAGFVTLKVYDMIGREVQSLVNGQLTAGEYISEFNGANLTSGTYFYRLQVGDFVQTKKMVLVK